eukprot:13281111-Alexandrium_andersonii.AAC.1
MQRRFSGTAHSPLCGGRRTRNDRGRTHARSPNLPTGGGGACADPGRYLPRTPAPARTRRRWPR